MRSMEIVTLVRRLGSSEGNAIALFVQDLTLSNQGPTMD
jgi:hypothetical protein